MLRFSFPRGQFRSDFIGKRLKKPGFKRTYKNRNSKIIKGNIALTATKHMFNLIKKARRSIDNEEMTF